MRRSRIVTAVLSVMAALAVVSSSAAETPKSGGHLNLMQREDLSQGFAVHETSTIATSFPSMPCFNNLVVLRSDQAGRDASRTIVGELAEKWSWQDNYRNLVFFLRRNVKWHDGQPFTSKDVKFTFDMLREAPDAPAKLRINPRKDWYTNVEAVEAADPYTVVFRLKRPQPGLLVMLASGYTPIYAAHVQSRELPHGLHRHRAVQGEGVAQGRVRRLREEPGLLREGPALSRRAALRRDQASGGRAPPRSRPGSSTCPSRARPPRPRPSSSRRRCPAW